MWWVWDANMPLYTTGFGEECYVCWGRFAVVFWHNGKTMGEFDENIGTRE
jgi:hypothetical protein